MSEMDDAVTGLLAKLIAYDTTSRNANVPLIDFVADYLSGHGIDSLKIDYEAGTKTNLYATIGPDIAGGVVLSGHTDVVPVDGQNWSSDPFNMCERGGCLFGRGTADMKGFIAVALAMAPEFLARDLKIPIHLALSCDEEVGCTGVRPMIDHIRDHLPRPKAVVVGEPTSMQVVNAHKGSEHFCTEVIGHEAHSSTTDQGVNAIMVAGEIIGEINRAEQDMRDRKDPTGRFDPPYTTVHIGTIAGGTAENIIPRQCAFGWETRLLPGADPKEVPARIDRFAEGLLPAMRAVSPDTGIETRTTVSIPGLEPDPDSPAEALALHLAGANATGAVSYGTEAGLFQQAGIPAIICGPGSIDQAHKRDEFIALSELTKCVGFMRRLADHCAQA